MKEKLTVFDPIFTEIHYKLVQGSRYDGYCYFYNPETVLKISPITVVDRIEFLMGKKRFDEIMQMMST
jgi:hypothetical protein